MMMLCGFFCLNALLGVILCLNYPQLSHLKRIQKLTDEDISKYDIQNDLTAGKKYLQMVLCPSEVWTQFEDSPLSVKLNALVTTTTTLQVCKLAPLSRSEFDAWNIYWPMVFHPGEIERSTALDKLSDRYELNQKRYARIMREFVVTDGAALSGLESCQ